MKPSEIIIADAKQRGIDPRKVLSVIKKLIDSKQGLLMHQNNSVLFLRYIGDDNVELNLFTEDTPLTLAKSLKYFIDRIRKSDLRAVYGKADNQQILEMLRRVGIDVRNSDKPKYNWMAFV